jgi:hypothetical protein
MGFYNTNERISQEAEKLYKAHKNAVMHDATAQNDIDYFSREVKSASKKAVESMPSVAAERRAKAHQSGQKVVRYLIEKGETEQKIDQNLSDAATHYQWNKEAYHQNAIEIDEAKATGYEPRFEIPVEQPAQPAVDIEVHLK